MVTGNKATILATLQTTRSGIPVETASNGKAIEIMLDNSMEIEISSSKTGNRNRGKPIIPLWLTVPMHSHLLQHRRHHVLHFPNLNRKGNGIHMHGAKSLVKAMNGTPQMDRLEKMLTKSGYILGSIFIETLVIRA